MIELRNVSKKFNDHYVLKNVTMSFPRYGLVIINGPSGCGKTTLLHILGTLLDSEGEVSIDGKVYSRISEQEKEIIRSQKIGFIFQDYKLFEYETVKQNIALAINISSADTKVKKNKRIQDLLRLVNLSRKENELVSNLSGGEKQRVAIARSIAHSPSVILADEPTGNLDIHNTEIVMELLQKISASSLIIMVSHDEALTKKYADVIINMKDGEITDTIHQNKKEHHSYIPIIKLKYRVKSRLLPFSFLFRHTLNSIKRRKWRSLLITGVTSLGLIGVALASTLSTIIYDNLYRSYTSILDDDRLILSPKEIDNSPDIIESLSYEKMSDIYEENKTCIDYIGVYYCNDFDHFFTYNVTTIDKEGEIKPLPNLTIKYINEFNILNKSLNVIPEKLEEIGNNEFVLSSPFSFVNEICYQLGIERTLNSFNNYLERNELYIKFIVSNINWGYEMDFSLRLRGFILSNKVEIYHSNPIWNEYIFDTKLALPSTSYLNVNTSHPWDLKKGYYFAFNNKRDEFLKEYRFNFENNDIDFEILDNKYYPNLYKDTETYFVNRLLGIKRTNRDYIPSFIGNFCKETSPHIKSVIYGSSNGYAIYDKSLMVGFSKNSYLSSEYTNIEDIIDILSYVKYEDSQSLKLPNNTVEGHFSKSNMNGFIFDPNYSLIQGRRPDNYQEIVVSLNLCKSLGLDNPINKTIYFTFPVIEKLLPNGYVSKDFKSVGLKVVGISNSGKLAIHNDESWTILFFQTMLGISSFDLKIENYALQIDKAYESSVIKKLNRAFPQFEVYSPLKDVTNSVNQICHYIEVILLVVSISSVLIASLILFICNYLHYLEAKKDIGLVRCLGSKKSESLKFVFYHSFIMTFFSLLLSILELFMISLFLAKSLSSSLGITSVFILNPMSIVYMVAVDLFISLISSILISRKISKLDPLDCLR